MMIFKGEIQITSEKAQNFRLRRANEVSYIGQYCFKKHAPKKCRPLGRRKIFRGKSSDISKTKKITL